jgi:hypothetical protein
LRTSKWPMLKPSPAPAKPAKETSRNRQGRLGVRRKTAEAAKSSLGRFHDSLFLMSRTKRSLRSVPPNPPVPRSTAAVRPPTFCRMCRRLPGGFGRGRAFFPLWLTPNLWRTQTPLRRRWRFRRKAPSARIRPPPGRTRRRRWRTYRAFSRIRRPASWNVPAPPGLESS